MDPMKPRLFGLAACFVFAAVSLAVDEPAKDKHQTSDFPPARMIPAEGVVFHVEYEGLADHGKAWNSTAANAILHKAKLDPMLADFVTRLGDLAKSQVDEKSVADALSGDDLVKLYHHVFDNGFVFSCSRGDRADLILRRAGLRRGSRALRAVDATPRSFV